MATTPEPFPGYDDATAEDVLDAIDFAADGPEREDLKARIRIAESERAGGARKSVLEATTPVPAPAPAPPDTAEEHDTSGRPALADVAIARAAASHVRVIDSQEEN